MLNIVVALALLAPTCLTIRFSLQNSPLLPAMLAPLYGASSVSSALDLALKTSVLTFVRSDAYRMGIAALTGANAYMPVTMTIIANNKFML